MATTPSPAAPSPAAAVPAASLAALAVALAALLERETALVRAFKIAEIAPLQSEKTRLTLLFQTALKQGGRGKSPPATADKAWPAAGRRLAEAVIENERALRVGRTATERLIATVIRAVKQSRRPLASYAPRRGSMGEPVISGISLDRRL